MSGAGGSSVRALVLELASEGGGLGRFSCEGGLSVVGLHLGYIEAAVRCVYPRLLKLAVGITAEVSSEGVVYGG